MITDFELEFDEIYVMNISGTPIVPPSSDTPVEDDLIIFGPDTVL